MEIRYGVMQQVWTRLYMLMHHSLVPFLTCDKDYRTRGT
jgi:hypothetical protein